MQKAFQPKRSINPLWHESSEEIAKIGKKNPDDFRLLTSSSRNRFSQDGVYISAVARVKSLRREKKCPVSSECAT